MLIRFACTMSEISHKLTEEELGDLAVSDSTVYESNALESDTAIITQVSRGSWIFCFGHAEEKTLGITEGVHISRSKICKNHQHKRAFHIAASRQ